MVYNQAIQKARENKDFDPHVGDIFIRQERAQEFHGRRLQRSLQNWRYYLALDPEYGLGQHSVKMLAYLKSQGRDIATYNICKGYVDQIAGGIMQAPFDPEFFPINDEITSLTESTKNAMYSDKELCDWNSTYYELVRSGLVHQGVIKMVITDKYHKLGNISLDTVLPNHWIPDPMWVTVNTRDCKICWEAVYLMPQEALEVYGNKMKPTNDSRDLESLLGNYLCHEVEYGLPNGPTPFVNGDMARGTSAWGTALKFINEYRMIRKKYVSVLYHGPQGDMEIPESLDPAGKIDWLNQRFGQDAWDPYSIEEVDGFRSICLKETICPQLTWNGIICSAPCEVQIEQIPFWVWSADRVHGEPHGVIDLIKDSQDDVNRTNLMINHKLEVEGGGGGQFMDPMGFASPEEAERYKQHRNDPQETWETAPGLMVKSGMVPAKPVITSGFSPEVYKRLDHILNVMIPHTSKVVPATRGQTEQSGESGYLYNLKKIQSEQSLYTIHYMLRQFWNQVYEGYLMQAANQYSLGGVQRKFSTSGGKSTTIFNEPVQMPDGSVGIRNDASQLKQIRHKVIISDVQQTPTKKMEDLGLLTDYMRQLMPVANQKPVTIMYLTTKVANLIDPLSEKDKEAINEISAIEMETALTELHLRRLKAQKEIEMIENPPPPAGPPQGAPPGMAGIPQLQAPQAPGGQ